MLDSHYLDLHKNQETLWWYRGMKDISTMLLKRYLPKYKKLKILDAGCGPGAALKYLSKFGDTIGIDISDKALIYARKRGKVLKGDITKLPFKDSSFDLVFCFGVLYHSWVKDESKATEEFYRVLKKGGILLLEEPAYNWFTGNEDVIAYGKRRFTKSELKTLLEKSSFKIFKLSYINFFLFPLGILRRLPEIAGLRQKQPVSDIFRMPQVINVIFYSVLFIESLLLKFVNFPFGMSIICVAKKNEKNNQ